MTDLNRRAGNILWDVADEYGKTPPIMPWYVTPEKAIMPVCEFDPANRIEHAWMLVEFARPKWEIEITVRRDDVLVWFAEYKGNHWTDSATADTAPLAITRAFLAAVEGEG